MELTILYTRVSEGRYLRTLELPGNRFLNHNLNLGFIRVQNKNGIKRDYEKCLKILTGGNQTH